MKKIFKLFILPLALVLVYSCVSDDDSRFQSNPESGWIEFQTAETTVAVTSRTTSVTIPLNYTAPINSKTVTVTYDIVSVQGTPSSVASGLSTTAVITPNTNKTNITFDILPTAVATLIADGDVIFNIEITGASGGVPVGLSDGSAPIVHTVNLLCGGEPPIGTYVIDMHDSYGDGWQTDDASGGAGITVVTTNLAGEENVIEFGMCSPYGAAAGSFLGGADCTGPASLTFFDATTTIDIAPDVIAAVWNFPGDNWGEISFEIYKPDGSLLYAGVQGMDAGELPVSYCD